MSVSSISTGSVDFYRGWEDDKRGFGNLNGEFWLGLDKIHRLTSSGKYRLRVDLEDWDEKTAYAQYRFFSVGDEESKYKLSFDTVSYSYSGKGSGHNKCTRWKPAMLISGRGVIQDTAYLLNDMDKIC